MDMTPTQQSEQSSTSEYEPWFMKTNYMAKFLNSHSREIIKKINNEYKNSNR